MTAASKSVANEGIFFKFNDWTTLEVDFFGILQNHGFLFDSIVISPLPRGINIIIWILF